LSIIAQNNEIIILKMFTNGPYRYINFIIMVLLFMELLKKFEPRAKEAEGTGNEVVQLFL